MSKDNPADHHGTANEIARAEAVSFRQLLLAASVIGICGGLLALAYSNILHLLMEGVWTEARPWLASAGNAAGLPGQALSLLAITITGGCLVGLCLRWLGVPGEIAAVVNNIHLKEGRLPIRQTPSMIAASLLSIVAGGSAGPEAPLVQISGSIGSWLGDRLKWFSVHVRTLTFCGMAAALGAFFGAPLAGALFALEIPHRNGLEYYEALLPSLIAAFLSYWVFDSLSGHPHPIFPMVTSIPSASAGLIAKGIMLGAIGALLAHIFNRLFKVVRWLFERWSQWHVLLGATGGLLIGLLALASPPQLPVSTLFWGEFEMREILLSLQDNAALPTVIVPLLALGALKMLAVSVTLTTGFRGGFIFPLFFIGGVTGIALSGLTNGWFPLSAATLCVMAATNVGVTRTPVSTTVLLATLSGISTVPLLLAASLTSFLLTARVRMITTQRSRVLPGQLTWRDREQ